jgi:superfamily II DNA helicase RecQ
MVKNNWLRGLDFRPDYRKVAVLVSVFSDCPCLLLTATATSKIQTDLYNVLSLDDRRSFHFKGLVRTL